MLYGKSHNFRGTEHKGSGFPDIGLCKQFEFRFKIFSYQCYIGNRLEPCGIEHKRSELPDFGLCNQFESRFMIFSISMLYR